ncbi:hypothetical protein DAT299_18020 [Streptococcus suis]|nr:hypothetical protein DAT299_18020 [Streptococcus suis]
MAKNIIGLDLSSIADGGLQEKLNNELARVIENILDPNTDPTVKREVSIKLVLNRMTSGTLSTLSWKSNLNWLRKSSYRRLS